MEEKRYYPEMDRLRAVAILMVLLYHSILVYPINLTEQYQWCNRLHSFLWTVEMPLFFMVSGFCFVYRGHYIKYLKGKTLRILVPHVIFGMTDLLIRTVPTGLIRENFDPVDAIIEFVLYGANDWFLWTLFLMFVFAPLLYRIQHNNGIGKVIVLASAVVMYLLQNLVPGYFCARQVVQFLIFFLAGMVWRDLVGQRENGKNLCEDKISVRSMARFFLAAVFGIVGFILIPWYGWTGLEEEWRKVFHDGMMMKIREKLDFHFLPGITWVKIIYLSLCLITAFLLLYVVYWIVCYVIKDRFDGFLRLCSKYSLQMYLLDGYMLTVSRTLIVSVFHIRIPVIVILLNFVIDTAGVLFISHFILDRFRIFRVASGIKTETASKDH